MKPGELAGEVSAFSSPWYTEETIQTCAHMLRDFFIPNVVGREFSIRQKCLTVSRVSKETAWQKRGWNQPCGIYMPRKRDISRRSLRGKRDKVPAGVAVGLASADEMLREIEQYVKEGYQRIKIKIQPGHDVDLVRAIATVFRTYR